MSSLCHFQKFTQGLSMGLNRPELWAVLSIGIPGQAFLFLVQQLLSLQSYVMRNAILAAMTEVLLQVLNGDQLEEVARGTRDHFLSMLQAHICDISGFVRSRVLQLFTRIVHGKVSVVWKWYCLGHPPLICFLREFLSPCSSCAEAGV